MKKVKSFLAIACAASMLPSITINIKAQDLLDTDNIIQDSVIEGNPENSALSSRPNILILHTDQHRADCVGAYGNTEIHTPNIDKLAEDGVLYQNSFVSFPVCTPSRYSLITGVAVREHQGYINGGAMASGIDTFPQMLRDEGYQTKTIGKMHFGYNVENVGYEEIELAEKGLKIPNEQDYYSYLSEKGLKLAKVKSQQDNFGIVESTVEEEDHITKWTGDRAIDTINQWGEDGNLLFVGFNRPHRPLDPPAPWDTMYDPDQLTPLSGWIDDTISKDAKLGSEFALDELNEQSLKQSMASYYGLISQIDNEVGRIIDLLKERGMFDNTMIIYTSDHGEYMGFHHLMGKINYSYDAIIKVPLIIKYPGQKNKGQISDELISNIDLAPTILHQAGIEPATTMRGFDLDSEHEKRKAVFVERGRNTEYTVRTNSRKLIWRKGTTTSLYFDLDNDPNELNDLIDDPAYQDEISELQGYLDEWIKNTPPLGTLEEDEGNNEKNKNKKAIKATENDD